MMTGSGAWATWWANNPTPIPAWRGLTEIQLQELYSRSFGGWIHANVIEPPAGSAVSIGFFHLPARRILFGWFSDWYPAGHWKLEDIYWRPADWRPIKS